MIFHENLLPADNSHYIMPYLFVFLKSSKILNCLLLQILGGALWVTRKSLVCDLELDMDDTAEILDLYLL